MQVCTLLQTDNHASTPPLRFLRAGCPSCHPTNNVKAPIARVLDNSTKINLISTRSDTHQKLAAGNYEQQVRFSRTASYRSKTFQVLTKTSSVFKHLQVHFSLKKTKFKHFEGLGLIVKMLQLSEKAHLWLYQHKDVFTSLDYRKQSFNI